MVNMFKVSSSSFHKIILCMVLRIINDFGTEFTFKQQLSRDISRQATKIIIMNFMTLNTLEL